MHLRLRQLTTFLIIFVQTVGWTPAFAGQKLTTTPGKVVVVDAGHGGPDSGARGHNQIHEKDITLAVSKKLVALLRESGIIVIETRESDYDLATDQDEQNRNRHRGDLRGRLNIARKVPADAFVSIHCNAGPSPQWRGAQALYLEGNNAGETLAKIMQESFQQHLLPTNRAIESNRSLYLLKRISGPAVLAEIGFITNPEEASYLIKPDYQQRVAQSIYVSILKYFDEESLGMIESG